MIDTLLRTLLPGLLLALLCLGCPTPDDDDSSVTDDDDVVDDDDAGDDDDSGDDDDVGDDDDAGDDDDSADEWLWGPLDLTTAEFPVAGEVLNSLVGSGTADAPELVLNEQLTLTFVGLEPTETISMEVARMAPTTSSDDTWVMLTDQFMPNIGWIEWPDRDEGEYQVMATLTYDPADVADLEEVGLYYWEVPRTELVDLDDNPLPHAAEFGWWQMVPGSVHDPVNFTVTADITDLIKQLDEEGRTVLSPAEYTALAGMGQSGQLAIEMIENSPPDPRPGFEYVGFKITMDYRYLMSNLPDGYRGRTEDASAVQARTVYRMDNDIATDVHHTVVVYEYRRIE